MNYTAREYDLISTEDVLGYILAQNAARNAQAVAEGWEFWTTIPVKFDFVAEFMNAYELELRFARGAYSDVFKEWSGCRPHSNFSHMTLVELEGEITWMSRSIEESIKREEEEVKEMDHMAREEVALGMKRPASDMKLEQWEIYEAKAEAAGY
jgi:hypothetical protein